LWVLHAGPHVASQPPDTYPPWGDVMTSDWLEPEKIVWPAAGHTDPGVETTVEVNDPDTGFDRDSGCEIIVGEGRDGSRFVETGARSGAAGVGWPPGEALGGGGAASRPSDGTGGGSGMLPGCCCDSGSGTFGIGGVAAAGAPAFRAGTAAASTCGF